MSQLDVTSRQPEAHDPRQRAAHRHGRHGWMMAACCIPMLVIAIVLVATGVASIGFIFGAAMCMAMMVMMMRGMAGGPEQQHERPRD
jgi:hypothetical protein